MLPRLSNFGHFSEKLGRKLEGQEGSKSMIVSGPGQCTLGHAKPGLLEKKQTSTCRATSGGKLNALADAGA
jgi:hypothetical protein